MGMSPAEVGKCSLWEFGRTVIGFSKAHGGGDEKQGPPSDEAFLAAVKEARRAELRITP